MSLTEDDLKTLRLLIREEVRGEIQPFREEVNRRFRLVDERFDYLYKQDEKWEQEFLSIGRQLDRHDKKFETIDARLDRIEKKVDRQNQYFDDLDARIAALEKRSA